MRYKGQAFDTPGEALIHFGTKGMKWGVRKQSELSGLIKSDIVRKTSNGDTFTLSPTKPSLINKALAKVSKNYRDSYKTATILSINDKNGKKVGNFNFWRKGKDELYLNWIDVNKSARGQGYATAAMKESIEWAKKNKIKTVTLEVPGRSPDARHIYEKMGFKATRELTKPENDAIWGGLTEMQMKL